MSDPVVRDQVWHYGPLYHRDGRFITKSKRRDGFWICKEISKEGEERLYSELDIVSISAATLIQPGQIWIQNYTKEEMRILEPLPPYSFSVTTHLSPDDHRWSYMLCGLLHSTSDVNVRANTLLVLPPGANGIDRCPLCGSPGVKLFNMFECLSPSCQNRKRS